jgi:hypothetical protein
MFNLNTSVILLWNYRGSCLLGNSSLSRDFSISLLSRVLNLICCVSYSNILMFFRNYYWLLTLTTSWWSDMSQILMIRIFSCWFKTLADNICWYWIKIWIYVNIIALTLNLFHLFDRFWICCQRSSQFLVLWS